MPETKFEVGMTCGGCQGAVTRILKKLDGVESVDANLETKLVTISYDDSKVSPATMDEKLQKWSAASGKSVKLL